MKFAQELNSNTLISNFDECSITINTKKAILRVNHN